MSIGKEWDWMEDGSNVQEQKREYTPGTYPGVYTIYCNEKMKKEFDKAFSSIKKEWWEPLKD